MNRKLLFFAIFSFAIFPILHGQKKKDERRLSLRCLTFQMGGGLSEIFVHSLGAAEEAAGTAVTPKAYLNHERVELPLFSDKLVFTTEPHHASLKDPKKVLGTATVPDDLKTAIFMFFPKEKSGGEKMNILTLDDSKKAFPPGSLSFVNLASVPLQLQLEKESYVFKPGERKLIKDPPKNKSYAIGMRAFIRVDDEWKRIDASLWPHPGKKRIIKIAFYNPQTKQIEIGGVRDISIP